MKKENVSNLTIPVNDGAKFIGLFGTNKIVKTIILSG